MLDKLLTQELHRVADAAPVPADLFPPSLRSARRRAPRRWVMAVAAAAAALVLFGVTPIGSRVLATAGKVVMNAAVRLVYSEDPGTALPYLRTDTIAPGQTAVMEQPGLPRQVGTGYTLGGLRQTALDWPLPAYLAPPDEAQVVLGETFQPDTGALWMRSIYVKWTVTAGERPHVVTYSLTRVVGDHSLPIPGDGKPAVTMVTNDRDARLVERDVIVKGEPATAIKVANVWHLFWYNSRVGGSLMSTLPLEELVKVAESLPSLE